jgi:transcriptional regulator with XRE-family HTH domain
MLRGSVQRAPLEPAPVVRCGQGSGAHSRRPHQITRTGDAAGHAAQRHWSVGQGSHKIDHFAENMHRMAGVHGLTATETAELIGVARQTYSAWTRGRREPNTAALVRIRDLFEVDPLQMMRMPPEQFVPEVVGDRDRYARTEARIAVHELGGPVRSVQKAGATRVLARHTRPVRTAGPARHVLADA